MRGMRRKYATWAAVLCLIVLATSCSSEYDDRYYNKTAVITLIPKGAENQKTVALKPPYYQLRLARGYLSNDKLQSASFEIDALFPSMSHFTRSAKKIWYPDAVGVPINPDRLRIFLEFDPAGENDEGLQIERFLQQKMREGQFEVVAPPEKVAAVPELQTYRNRQLSSWEYYVFKQIDGRTVAVKCDLGCTGHTTWKGVLKLHYIFPASRLSEMVSIDRSVNQLVDTFQPTRSEQ